MIAINYEDYGIAASEKETVTTADVTRKPASIALNLQQVGQKFGDLTVLENLNLTIEPGSFVAIVGLVVVAKVPCCGLFLAWINPLRAKSFMTGKCIAC